MPGIELSADEEVKRILGELQFQVAVLRVQNASLVNRNVALQAELDTVKMCVKETEPKKS